jgi:hypothetical protein
MFADRVSFKVRVCPHVTVNVVNATEQWGTSHRYEIHGGCDTCGCVSEQVYRPAYTG